MFFVEIARNERGRIDQITDQKFETKLQKLKLSRNISVYLRRWDFKSIFHASRNKCSYL